MTSEQGHWILGLGILGLAVVIALHELGFVTGRWARYVLPVTAILAGLFAIFDKLLHGSAAPGNYAAETAQHTGQGLVVLTAGVVELLRANGRLTHRLWGLALPTALVVIGVVFLLHAQHDSAAPMLALLAQHRFFGLTLLVAAAARALGESGPVRVAAFKVVFPVLLALFGLQLIVYTEGGGGAHGSHAAPPASTSTGPAHGGH